MANKGLQWTCPGLTFPLLSNPERASLWLALLGLAGSALVWATPLKPRMLGRLATPKAARVAVTRVRDSRRKRVMKSWSSFGSHRNRVQKGLRYLWQFR